MLKINFQLQERGKSWDETPAKTLEFKDHRTKAKFARRLSYVTGKEVRMTEGNPMTASGSYVKVNHFTN